MKTIYTKGNYRCPICGDESSVTVTLKCRWVQTDLRGWCSRCKAKTKRVFPEGKEDDYYDLLKDSWMTYEERVASKLMED